MTDQSKSCEKAIEENFRVVVEIPRSWEERRYRRRFVHFLKVVCKAVCILLCGAISTALSAAICTSWVWIREIILTCNRLPNVSLEDVIMHDVVVYQNTTDTPYQVRSEFSKNLMASNENSVTKCFNTFCRMSVSVEFKAQQIVQQEVPLGFGLKPNETSTVMLEMRGDGYPLKKKSALLLDLELQNSSGMDFVFTFKSRAMRNDR